MPHEARGAPDAAMVQMSKTPVPDDVRRFILTSVPSVPFLEALLLLRAERHARWEPLGLARRLYIAEAQALELLQALQEAGVATRDEQSLFRYQPATDTLRDLLDVLAATYAANLVQVTDLIHSRLDKRAMQFADAFRFKKKEGP
jgi:hypothetical protein